MDQDQKTRLLESAKRLAQEWIGGLTPAESEILGGHSRVALERQFGSAFLEGFNLAKVEESLAGPRAKMEAASPTVPAPPPDVKTSKAKLARQCRFLGAPEAYINHYLGDKKGLFPDGTRRKPRREEKQRVCEDIEKACREEDTFNWLEDLEPEETA